MTLAAGTSITAFNADSSLSPPPPPVAAHASKPMGRNGATCIKRAMATTTSTITQSLAGHDPAPQRKTTAMAMVDDDDDDLDRLDDDDLTACIMSREVSDGIISPA